MSDQTELMEQKDQARLEFGLELRGNIVREIVRKAGPTGIPTDKEDRELLMRAIEGSDRTILAKAKIKSDDKNGKSQAAAAAMIGNFLSKMNGPLNHTVRSTNPVLEDDSITPVPGETDIGVKAFTYAEIMAGGRQD